MSSSTASVIAAAKVITPEACDRQEREWNSIPDPELDNVKWPKGCEVVKRERRHGSD